MPLSGDGDPRKYVSSAVGELVIRRLRRGARLAGCRLFRFRFSVGRTAALILSGNLSAKVR